MSRPHVPDEVQHFHVDMSDPKIQQQGQSLMHQLFEIAGMGKATGVLYVALTEMFMFILHTESPLAENNIAAIEELIQSLKDNVEEHKTCALRIGEMMKQQQAAANGDIVEPLDDEPETPTCH